ncbi:hypothetical protein [Paenibacillus amylolyticus]|uniref:hypothetical protein n=1 Tax=Paenibacillus amylolyticus TaxID=1451 RepID=UPI003394AADD
MKRVLHTNYYDNLLAEVEVARVAIDVTDQEAANRFENTIIILRTDHIVVLSDFKETIITDGDSELYSFEIVIKNQPPPIDPRTLSHQQILELLEDPAYMLKEEDMRKVPWSISQAYQWLKQNDPSRIEFVLSASAYRVESKI